MRPSGAKAHAWPQSAQVLSGAPPSFTVTQIRIGQKALQLPTRRRYALAKSGWTDRGELLGHRDLAVSTRFSPSRSAKTLPHRRLIEPVLDRAHDAGDLALDGCHGDPPTGCLVELIGQLAGVRLSALSQCLVVAQHGQSQQDLRTECETRPRRADIRIVQGWQRR